ncbi:MAG: UDP-N-acetylmuramoyl-L-alanyl-D-glutamate--2,6-diaminopimelate ligase [Deltaproteobacteria bacterium]|nr:UDP-N-acetylmuramoyl-L-alanyl-D-glutamate--2,6-diaminopimelate ligase [Deltaproteobacteria bacterium]
MKIKDLLKNLSCAKVIGKDEINVSNIHYDSRKIKKEGLFIAIQGKRFDGHDFIEEAKKNGACAVLVQRQVKTSLLQIIVKDSRMAMAIVSKNFFKDPSSHMTVVGVTGTNGKTTTTYILEALFNTAGFKPCVIGTINYRIGQEVFPSSQTTPESMELQRIMATFYDKGATHLFMEISSHALSLARVEGIEFDQAIFTNLTRDHLDFHETFENYFQAKAIFFEKILPRSLKPKKCSLINWDDSYGRKLILSLRETTVIARDAAASCGDLVISYSLNNTKADFYWKDLEFSFEGLSGILCHKDQEIEIKSPLVGMHNASNIIACVASALTLGLSWKDIQDGVKKIPQIPGRLEKILFEGGPKVFVDYAHTPDALKNVLNALLTLRKKEKIIVVFGCGGDRDKTKRPLMASIAQELADCVVITSDNPRSEDSLAIIEDIKKGINHSRPREGKDSDPISRVHIEPDRTRAIEWTIKNATNQDIILIAGKGHETYQILKDRTISFDDRIESKKALLRYWS